MLLTMWLVFSGGTVEGQTVWFEINKYVFFSDGKLFWHSPPIILTQFFTKFSFDPSWKHQKTKGLTMFSGKSKSSIGKNRLITISRSISPEVFLEKRVLNICRKFTGEHPHFYCPCNRKPHTFLSMKESAMPTLLQLAYYNSFGWYFINFCWSNRIIVR